MKKYHKINPFWTYSRSERLGIAILTIGILTNAMIKWQNSVLLKEKIHQINTEVIAQPSVKDTIPVKPKDEPKSEEQSLTHYKPKKKKIRKINLAISTAEDLIEQNIDSSLSHKIIQEKDNYNSWRSLCINDPKCKQLLDNKQLYYWIDQSTLKIDINEADSTTFKQLKGIGSVLSKRIIKYRTKLGGFIHTKQLQEVWGLNPETFDQISTKIFIGKKPDKLILNKHPKQFTNHPYLPYSTKDKIVNYLKFNSKDTIYIKELNLPYLSDTVIIKLSDYFE